jgi:hypothetical protein
MLPIRRIAATLPIALLVLASSARADFAYNYYEGSWSSIPTSTR